MCFNCFKVAFLFIGALVGAGFASGSEIIVFFGNSGIISPLIGGLIIGILSLLFAFCGKVLLKKNKVNVGFNYIIYLTTIITYIAMIAGAESLIRDCFNIRYVGLVSGIIVAIISNYNMKFTKNLNFIIVPVIIILMIIIAVKVDFLPFNGKVKMGSSLLYATMNILLGGILLVKECEKMSSKSIYLTCGIITVVTCVMLAIMYNIAMNKPDFAMPVFEVARGLGYSIIACFIIYFSIFSTLLGAGKLINDMTKTAISFKYGGTVFLVLLTIVCYNANFKFIVNTFYPITGYVGLIICLYIISISVINTFPKLSKQKIANKI